MVDNVSADARKILERFAKELESVKVSKIVDSSLNDSSTRTEIEGGSVDVNFRTTMFKNAPQNDGECLIVEKGAWN